MKFTVVLQRPDYITDNYGLDTYTALVEAPTAQEAVRQAQLEVQKADMVDGEPQVDNPDDYAMVVVFEGHCKMVLNGQW